MAFGEAANLVYIEGISRLEESEWKYSWLPLSNLLLPASKLADTNDNDFGFVFHADKSQNTLQTLFLPLPYFTKCRTEPAV